MMITIICSVSECNLPIICMYLEKYKYLFHQHTIVQALPSLGLDCRMSDVCDYIVVHNEYNVCRYASEAECSQ